MADGRRPRKPRRTRGNSKADAPREPTTQADETPSTDATERLLARGFALGVPSFGVAAALIVATVGGLGPALLVLAGTALLGTIGFFWASLRTLSGDAPLPEGMLATAVWSRTPAPEKKREALRALKDLELEHSMGKIDDDDYRELSRRYRETAKSLMRDMDAGLAPRRERAEALVRSYLDKRGLGETKAVVEKPKDEAAPVAPASPTRVPCASCSTANDLDAAFCKKCGSPLTTTTEKADAAV
jgi:hypothetical protein